MAWYQFLKESWPSLPKFTEKQLGDQTGKVFIVTGTTSGVGKELSRILFAKNAKVYTAARNPERASNVNTEIKSQYPESKGELIFLKVDLEDLNSVKVAAHEFLSKESCLHVLWHNAAVLLPPRGSKTKQDWDLQLGVNCLAPFLFTKLLTPALISAAKTAPEGSVRVMFVSSSAAYLFAPPGGVEMVKLKDKDLQYDPVYMYGVSKAGVALYALGFAQRYQDDGIIAVSGNPGNLNSDLPRHVSWWGRILMRPLQYPPVYGAYTELYGGLSPDITLKHTGAWLMPWGQIGTLRNDIAQAGESKDEGGSGVLDEFWAWSEEQVREYL